MPFNDYVSQQIDHKNMKYHVFLCISCYKSEIWITFRTVYKIQVEQNDYCTYDVDEKGDGENPELGEQVEDGGVEAAVHQVQAGNKAQRLKQNKNKNVDFMFRN